MARRVLCVLAALGQLFIPGRAHAQEAPAWPSDADEPAAEAKVGKVLRAFRITGSTPQIDGRLDEEVWALADAIDDLIQVEPGQHGAADRAHGGPGGL